MDIPFTVIFSISKVPFCETMSDIAHKRSNTIQNQTYRSDVEALSDEDIRTLFKTYDKVDKGEGYISR
jgi:hypothetical protein